MHQLAKSIATQNLLDAFDGISYLTDRAGLIIAVGTKNWDTFAAANDARELTATSIIGKNLRSFLSGERLQDQFDTILNRLAAGVQNRWVLPFRCDAPDRQRNMRQAITPVHEDGSCRAFLFQSIELSTTQRPTIDLFDFKEMTRRATETPDLPTIHMCSWCQRVNHPPTTGENWLPPEEYYAAGGTSEVAISHSICDTCFEDVSGR